MPPEDDRRLVALYDAHAPSVWRYVVHLTGDAAGADDIVQETLLRAWRSPRILAQEPASTRSWMFTVARNLVIDEVRSARRRHEIGVAETPERGARDGTDALFESLLIEEALATLDLEHRAVIVHAVLRRMQHRRGRPAARHPRGHREVAPALRAARPAPGAAGERGDAMNPDHARFAEWDSAYVLGALSPGRAPRVRGAPRDVRRVPPVGRRAGADAGPARRG